MSPLEHLGLNLAFLTPGKTGGMEIYARELVPAIRRLRPGLRITAFANRDARQALAERSWLDGVEVVGLGFGSSRPGWVLCEQLSLPRAARRAGVDLLHSMASTGPARTPCPHVVTVHDLIYHHHPEAHGRVRAMGMGVLVPLAARRAARVIADSRATAADVRALIGVPPERVDVVYLGPGAAPSPEATPEALLRDRLALGDGPIVLSVSVTRPHKNVARLLEALARVAGDPPATLVLSGYATRWEDELRGLAARLGLSRRVSFPGWLGDADLEGLYAAATCFVFPSLYEGFGMPVLEAMRRGVPVACSNRSSLPEIAGEAALLFDPEDTAAIATAIERLLNDPELRDRLARTGPEQARRFDWDTAAAETLAVYERALSPRQPAK